MTELMGTKMSHPVYGNINTHGTRNMDSRNKRNQTPQHTGSDSVKIRRSRSAVVCLVLLCVLLLTAVIVLCVHIHTNNTNYTQETHQLLTKITNLTEDRAELLTIITNLTEEREQILNKNINLSNERDGLLNKNNNLEKQRDKVNQEKNEMLKSLREMDSQRLKMSDSIYGNINTDEIWEMDSRDGEELKSGINGDTTKSRDVRTRTEKQTPGNTGSDYVKTRSSRAAVACLVLLCVLLLTAVIVLCVQVFTNIDLFQLKSKNIMEERLQLLTKISNVSEKREWLLNKNINVTNERDELISKNTNLTKQRDQFKQERDELLKTFKETDGWLYFSFSFYFFSSEKKSWTESRRYCTERGADLIIINNTEEQEFAKKFSHGNEFWIGLTDIDVEGKWKWVDGSTLTSGFWASGQPNGNKNENCAVTYSPGWTDYPCIYALKWICEKSIVKYTRKNIQHLHSLMVLDCKRAEMSVGIYNNVIRTESLEINKDRVDKTVEIYESADCVRDHDFRTETKTHQPPQQTGSDSVKIRNYRAAVVCLVLLCVLLLTAVIVQCVHIHTNNTNLTNKKDGLLIKNDTLTKQREQFFQERNYLAESLQKIDGRLYYNFSFYFISSEKKSWNESRRYCTKEKEADLIIINNREEQDFVRKIANNAYVWIGLTDTDVEGTWKWVDGSTLTSGFWDPREPNGKKGENCALSYSPGWADFSYGWLYSSFSFYFISSLKNSWTESRRYCTERGADLIIINNREEQDFVNKLSCGTNVWIGLTDREVEGTWKWVDGSTPTSRFWMSKEPNSFAGDEDCAINNSGWADFPCNTDFPWICEKSFLK
ncbi:lymphocyte antigen 75-like [Labeo rohita]|uniref:lymphocyte antigen 75-like n=1 Tax=Labeo rohita TaxID=84645 RepID=UPI0021E2AEED|nr:lymphocyte antigen 75-like [Labeo rohita]